MVFILDNLAVFLTFLFAYLLRFNFVLSRLVPKLCVSLTGLLPVEKLYEELLTAKEITLPTHQPKIKIAPVEKLDYSVLLSRIDVLVKNAYILSKQEVVDLFKEIVPEYKSSNDQYNGKPAKKSLKMV